MVGEGLLQPVRQSRQKERINEHQRLPEGQRSAGGEGYCKSIVCQFISIDSIRIMTRHNKMVIRAFSCGRWRVVWQCELQGKWQWPTFSSAPALLNMCALHVSASAAFAVFCQRGSCCCCLLWLDECVRFSPCARNIPRAAQPVI